MTARGSTPLDWPLGVPRSTPTKSRFKDWTVARAMQSLISELTRFAAREVVITTNIELRRDGLPRSASYRTIARHGGSRLLGQATSGFAALPAAGATPSREDKLRALVEHGSTEGERTAAQTQLDALRAKA